MTNSCVFMMRGAVFIILSFYQKTISPDHGVFVFSSCHCRFFPSCSVYTKDAISWYGLARGIMISLVRIARCGPWSSGGYDPVGEIKKPKLKILKFLH